MQWLSQRGGFCWAGDHHWPLLFRREVIRNTKTGQRILHQDKKKKTQKTPNQIIAKPLIIGEVTWGRKDVR